MHNRKWKLHIKFLPEKMVWRNHSHDTDKGLVEGLLASWEEPCSKELVVIIQVQYSNEVKISVSGMTTNNLKKGMKAFP
jgi:hypothetical protein